MIDFLSITLPLGIILVISAFLTTYFKYKIEHANFIVVCSIVLLIIISGILGILQVGFYSILVIALFSLVFLIINFKKIVIRDILTPGTTGYILSVLIYSFIIKDLGVVGSDAASHWALATKSMYLGNTFYKGIQTTLTPSFNYFIVKCSVFVPAQLFRGAWILIWSAFILPLGGVGWKNWKKVGIYMFAVYCLTGYIFKSASLFIDETMCFISGALAAYWALQEKKGVKEYILAGVGLLALAQAKDSFGAVCAMMVALFMIADEFIRNFSNIKKIIWKSIVLFLIPVAGYFLSVATMEKPDNYYQAGKLFDLPFFSQLLNSKTYLLLALLLLVCFVIYIIFVSNKKKVCIKSKEISLYSIAGYVLLAVFAVFIYKSIMLLFESMSFDELKSFINAWVDYSYHSSGGRTNTYIASLIIIYMVFVSVLAMKKELRKINLIRTGVLLSFPFVIGALVLLAFSAGYYESGQYADSVSWERYISVPFITMLTFAAGYYMTTQKIYINRKAHLVAMGFCLLILVKYMPYPGTVLLSKYTEGHAVTASIINAMQEDAVIIKEHLEYEDTVFVASYAYEKNAGEYGISRTRWLKYEIAPIESNWNYNEDYDATIGSTGTIETHAANIAKYDYFYVQSAGPEYYDKFSALFPDGKYYYSNALYKVDYSNGVLSLSPVYLDESRLLP